jgi:L-amino acid N-acyltransferase YncA
VRIRDYEDGDWAAIWPVFSDIVTAGETYAYPAGLSSEQARDLWVESTPAQTVVAVEGTRLLGTAKMGPNRPGRGSHVATASFMISADARGTGVGRALGEYALDWARRHGYTAMQFNAVVETNKAAVHLWQSLGFEIIGTVPEAFDHRELGLVGLHVMYQKF